MRVLVTGAAGFIGSHLCEGLVRAGYQPVGLDDLSTGSKEHLSHVPSAELVVGDVRDQPLVEEAAWGCDVILHHAALRAVERSVLDPVSTAEVNILGTLSVLRAAERVGARVINASSSSVYGDQPRFPVTEDVLPHPKSPYAASKLAGEAYCEVWSREFGVPTMSFRYFNVYGPRQDSRSEYAVVVPRFFLACLEGARPEIHGDGDQARDLTFIDDVVRANLLAIEAPAERWGGVMNIGGGHQPTSVNELLAEIQRLTGTDLVPVTMAPRKGDVRRTHADISLAREVLGYGDTTLIHEGLRQTYRWFVEWALR